MVDLSSLNANQLESVNWNDGPLLVLAGPGSGKTRVLTFRIARITEESAGEHFKILGLTFTNRAAAEMRQRIDFLVPNAADRILLTTFHSFSANILRQHGHHIGLRPDFTILSQEADRESVLNEAIERTHREHYAATYSGQRLLPVVTRLLEYCVSVDDSIEVLQRRNLREAQTIATIYRNYRYLMIDNNQLDFASIMAETLRLLELKPAVRRQVNRVYTQVCVDEFQDTNLAQYRLLCNVVNRSTRNLFVVADDDQIIYQWNGAHPKRLRSLRQDFDMSVLQLPENYRCPPAVIDVANRLIKHNLSHDSAKAVLIAHKQGREDYVIRVKDFASLDEEADWVASDIASRPSESRYRCVILARTRRLLERMVKGLGIEECLELSGDA